ncbi:MAG: glycosyltransferase [Flavobacteriales bacterium]
MSLYFSILMLFTFSYSVLILLHGFKWNKRYTANVTEPELGITVVIPFRNEEENLPACLTSLKNTEGNFRYEFIFVDDHSADRSVDIINDAALPASRLLRLTDTHGKKAAIAKAVGAARYDYIILLDADSTVTPGWLQSMLLTAVSGNFRAVGALVKFREEKSFLNKFLNVEMASLMGITAGGINLGFPVLANGTNFLFSKEVFQAVGGYSNDRFASGDDVFLLQKIVEKFGAKSIAFNSDEIATVTTKAPSSFIKLLQQRVRWAGKTKGYRFLARMFTAFVGLYNIMMALAVVSLVFAPYLFAFVLAMFICKMAMDALLTLPVLSRTSQQKLAYFIPAVALLYPFYVLVTAAATLVLRPEWKGRKIA